MIIKARQSPLQSNEYPLRRRLLKNQQPDVVARQSETIFDAEDKFFCWKVKDFMIFYLYLTYYSHQEIYSL